VVEMTGTYHHRHVVTFDETNLVGNVYFAHYLHWQGHCRELFLAQRAPSTLAEVRAGELALATVSCGMDYYAECFALDEIDIEMSLRELGGHRIALDFRFRRGEELVAAGTQTVACLRRGASGSRPVAIPDELRRAVVAAAAGGR
jgi:enediyne core biosynthesis thioesterase